MLQRLGCSWFIVLNHELQLIPIGSHVKWLAVQVGFLEGFSKQALAARGLGIGAALGGPPRHGLGAQSAAGLARHRPPQVGDFRNG